MFLILKFLNRFRLWPLGVLFLTSCQVSEKWAQQVPSNLLPMNHEPSRSAVQATSPAWMPVAAVASSSYNQQFTEPLVGPQASVMQVPVANYRSAVQTTAIRAVEPQVAPSFQPAQIYRSAPRGQVTLVNGLAVAPPDAPAVVRRAVEAGNRLQKMPYKWGGGHAQLDDNGYDCSGTVSYVLREAGLLKGQMISKGFFTYGESGEGEWITVWAKKGHVFMTIGGLRLDTGGSTTRTGPRWKTKSRSYKGCVARHPRGL